MYNEHERLEMRLMELGVLHQRALDNGDTARAKYLSDEYDEVERKLLDLEDLLLAE